MYANRDEEEGTGKYNDFQRISPQGKQFEIASETDG